MTVTESFVERNLKIRIGPKGVTREYSSDVITHADSRKNSSVNGNTASVMNIDLKLPYQGQFEKRGPVTVLENQIEKRRKINRGIKQQCANLLKDLQNHRCGWPFKEPVDPVAYKIPDYFSVVKNPMDLGTIESKLEKNVYFSVEEFAADVRLTFSNCMLYNPSYNQFHLMARELNNYFESTWKLMEKKLKFETKNAMRQCISKGEVTQGKLLIDHKANPSKVSSLSRREMAAEEKQELAKDLKELLRRNMTEKVQSCLKKYNLCRLKESIDMDIDGIDDNILWELKKTTKNLLKVTAGKTEAAKDVSKRFNDVSRVSCSSEKVKPPASSVNSKCDSCGSLTCRCSFSSNKVQSCKNFASETLKRPGPNPKGVSTTDRHLEHLTASCSGRLDRDTNGSGSVVEEAACMSPDSSVCGSDFMSDQGGTPAIDLDLSPKKALRAAMLKSRFAGTIFKARHKTLLDQGDKVDPVKLQLEKEKLEKQHREEKARIEAQIVAAEAASRLRARSELKLQREREREAARTALEQMERTVDIEDNLKFLRDLELMTRSPDSGCSLAGNPRNSLERLGLYFKDDFVEDDDVVADELVSREDGEKGEIIK